MKSIVLATLLLAAPAVFTTTAEALRGNCLLTNAGGCVKSANNWIEFCPASGVENIEPVDKTDKDCVSIKPFEFAEFSSSAPTTRYVIKNEQSMSFSAAGGYTRHVFTTTCTDRTVPCAIGKSVEATKFTVQMTSSGTTKILIDLFIFGTAGVVSFDGQAYNVAAGSFKFDIRSDSYEFVNSDCDSISLDVKMRTLSGGLAEHLVDTSSAAKTTIDGHVVSPTRYAHYAVGDVSSAVFGPVSIAKANRVGSDVVTFELRGLPSGKGFRYDPFVIVPGTSGFNNSAPSVLSMGLACIFVVVGALFSF